MCPLGRDKIQEARAWVWAIARAHKVNAENILEIRGERRGQCDGERDVEGAVMSCFFHLIRVSESFYVESMESEPFVLFASFASCVRVF